MYILQNVEFVECFPGTGPETDRNGAAIAGDWVSLKNYAKVVILLKCGGLGADIAIACRQATTVAGAGPAKAIAGKTHTFTNGVDENTTAEIHITGDELDVNNGFDCIQVYAADPGGALTYLTGTYALYVARYSGATMPTATID